MLNGAYEDVITIRVGRQSALDMEPAPARFSSGKALRPRRDDASAAAVEEELKRYRVANVSDV